MSKFDHLGLDGNTLTTFLTVLEEMSVSRAAERLGVTQSAVSHTLEKLRTVFNDPSCVRCLYLESTNDLRPQFFFARFDDPGN